MNRMSEHVGTHHAPSSLRHPRSGKRDLPHSHDNTMTSAGPDKLELIAECRPLPPSWKLALNPRKLPSLILPNPSTASDLHPQHLTAPFPEPSAVSLIFLRIVEVARFWSNNADLNGLHKHHQ